MTLYTVGDASGEAHLLSDLEADSVVVTEGGDLSFISETRSGLGATSSVETARVKASAWSYYYDQGED